MSTYGEAGCRQHVQSECALQCNCSWSLAQAIWARHSSGGAARIEELKSAEWYFLDAISLFPADPKVRSAYATFLWKGLRDLKRAEVGSPPYRHGARQKGPGSKTVI
jgi:hypothetical protein